MNKHKGKRRVQKRPNYKNVGEEEDEEKGPAEDAQEDAEKAKGTEGGSKGTKTSGDSEGECPPERHPAPALRARQPSVSGPRRVSVPHAGVPHSTGPAIRRQLRAGPPRGLPSWGGGPGARFLFAPGPAPLWVNTGEQTVFTWLWRWGHGEHVCRAQNGARPASYVFAAAAAISATTAILFIGVLLAPRNPQ